jgi:peptide/nickel transport system permease protein
MGKYALKRILLLLPTLFFVCVIIFALIRLVPGSAVDTLVSQLIGSGMNVSREDIEASLGMDKPAIQQFFIWLSELAHGDLGDSFFQNRSVSEILGSQLPITLELSFLILIFTNLISIPLGLYCAARQDTIGDNVIRLFSVIGMSIPLFWIAALILVYPAVWWKYAPPSNYVGFLTDPVSNLQMFIVPAILGALAQAGVQTRAVRTMTLEVMRQDFIRTAWAKGVTEKRILFLHAFRNSMIPIVTIIGNSVSVLIGGSVILETMFNIPGIGFQVIAAISNRDYPLVQGCVLIFSIFTMLINFIVDLAYKWIDPRIELE